MKIPPVKGTRDFYPADMRIRNFIIDGWKKVSLRNGFEEYDGPIFEYLQMYQLKSGDEIAEQLFNLVDRGGRELAIRPEITPTLARMVNQQINSLPRPIKWFSVPRLCRAERPQKGRLREFFQWNIDVIGVEDEIADAEVIFCALDYLQAVGLTSNDIVVKISSRAMLAEVLAVIGIEKEQLNAVYSVLDKRSKIPEDAFIEMLMTCITDSNKRADVIKLMSVKSFEEIASIIKSNEKIDAALGQLRKLFEILDTMGVSDFCQFDIGIVRGLAYYTGIVFEIFDKKAELRAIGGGGRYDDLLKTFGGPAIPATGFGIGDCVLGIILEEKGLLGQASKNSRTQYFAACVDQKYFAKAVELTSKLRRKGISVALNYKVGNLGKQLKQVSAQNAEKCLIIGSEIESGQVAVKNMTDGTQQLISIDDLLI
ncbi:MAG: histidine--tRNA ligase [Phycisphaerae bacterium]